MNPVTLRLAVARCPKTRTGDCWQAGNCARALVLHVIGRPVQDYTQEDSWTPKACPGFMPAGKYRTAPASVPVVHDAPRGLS